MESRTVENYLEKIGEFPALCKESIVASTSTSDLVDILGAINSTQTAIGKIKLTAASEVESEDTGERWRYEQPQRGVRSYNNSGMFSSLMQQLGYESLVPLLQFLLDADVIRIQWMWSNLEKLIHNRDVWLRTASHEIKEGDPAFDMGEYWVRGSAGYKPVEGE